uniref:Putative secreted protein n=1 Tax=Ixodes ricinus TaxID=34613 RepID=A0A6B0UA79_IXORI
MSSAGMSCLVCITCATWSENMSNSFMSLGMPGPSSFIAYDANLSIREMMMFLTFTCCRSSAQALRKLLRVCK